MKPQRNKRGDWSIESAYKVLWVLIVILVLFSLIFIFRDGLNIDFLFRG